MQINKRVVKKSLARAISASTPLSAHPFPERSRREHADDDIYAASRKVRQQKKAGPNNDPALTV
jgi:hypothetical protein